MRSRRYTQLLVVALLVFVLSACARPPVGPGLSIADSTAITAEIAAYATAMGTADVTWPRFFTDDAVLMVPNLPPLEGRELLQSYAKLLPPMTAFTVQPLEIVGRDDMAYEYGRYTSRATLPSGIDIPDSGSYVVIWRRQADSTWKRSRDIYNSDNPVVPPPTPENVVRIRDIARRYTAAWNSHHATLVARFFGPFGSLAINHGPPARGHHAIRDVAQGFMTAFPDLKLYMDSVVVQGDDRAVYYWTLVGTNNGPGGSGKRVRISGFEQWWFDADWLIDESLGHFDADDYKRQSGG